jgi:hypothetical protein
MMFNQDLPPAHQNRHLADAPKGGWLAAHDSLELAGTGEMSA